jgi:hypothetical protein
MAGKWIMVDFLSQKSTCFGSTKYSLNSGSSVVISSSIRFIVDLMTYFSCLNHNKNYYEFWEIEIQNGGEI